MIVLAVAASAIALAAQSNLPRLALDSYPAAARANSAKGTAQLAFSLDRQGKVTAARVTKSSGSGALDQEALDLVRRAQPFPPPPAAMPGAQIDLTVPVRFNVH